MRAETTPRTEMRIEDTFNSQLLPYVRDNAVPIAELRSLIAGGLDAAGEKHGNPGVRSGRRLEFPALGQRQGHLGQARHPCALHENWTPMPTVRPM